MTSELRNLLKGQTIDSTTASTLHDVGGRVFLDGSSIAALNDFAKMADSWRGVHALAYGGPIGGTDTTTTHQMQTDSIEAVLTPSDKQVLRVVAAQVSNSGGAPMTADLLIGGVIVTSGLTINPSESGGFDIRSDLFIGANTPLQVHITSGTVSDAQAKVAHISVGL